MNKLPSNKTLLMDNEIWILCNFYMSQNIPPPLFKNVKSISYLVGCTKKQVAGWTCSTGSSFLNPALEGEIAMISKPHPLVLV